MARAHPAPVCLFEAMVNAHDDAMFTVDGQGTVSSWNRAAERLFGYAAQQALGLPLAALLADEPQTLDAPVTGEQAASVQRVLRDRHGMLLSVLVTRTAIDGPEQLISMALRAAMGSMRSSDAVISAHSSARQA